MDADLIINTTIVILVIVLLWFILDLVDLVRPEICVGTVVQQVPQVQQSQQVGDPVAQIPLTIPNDLGVTVFNPEAVRPRSPGLTNGLPVLPDLDKPKPGETDPKLDISDIPFSNSGCMDQFSSCPDWSKNGECTINPEFMLENCPYSCNRCGLNREQKNRIIDYHMSMPPSKCLTRGVPYPSYYKLFTAAYDSIA